MAEAARKISGRPADLTARFGGEEFVIVLPGTDLAGVQAVGEKVRQCVEDLQVLHEASSAGGFLTVSIGAASMIPRRSDSFVETADVALYQAKRSGKNRVVTLGQARA